MFRLAPAALIVAFSVAAGQPALDVPPRVAALTKQFQDKGAESIMIREKTRDAASRTQVVVIHADGGEKVALRPGMTVYFKLDKAKNEYTKSGGWYWSAGAGMEQSRIRGAEVIKAVRDPAGFIDWYRVESKK